MQHLYTVAIDYMVQLPNQYMVELPSHYILHRMFDRLWYMFHHPT